MSSSSRCWWKIWAEPRFHWKIWDRNSHGWFVDSLKNKIYERVNKINNKIFSDIKASQLELWKVHIHTDNEEKLSKLSLKNDDTEGIKELQRVISEYWEEQPPTKFIHVIIDSPYLTTLRKLKALTTGDSGRVYHSELYYAPRRMPSSHLLTSINIYFYSVQQAETKKIMAVISITSRI